MKIGIPVVLLILLLAGPTACTHRPGQPPVQSEELYHYNWWNYYPRGIARMSRGEYGSAREDFENCLGIRSEARSINRRDVWLERTYGVHLIENYFPNRELGICLYQAGDYSNAVHYLEQSLQDEPSGRAKHYLNLARRRELAATTTTPPVVALEPQVSPWTKAREALVRGTAQGAGYIDGLAVNDRAQFVELAEAQKNFSEKVALREGPNRIRVAARDLLGREAAAEQTLLADWQPPQIVITHSEQKGVRIAVAGACYDQQALGSVVINGRTWFQSEGDPLVREVPFELELDARAPLLVQAEDRAGNPLEWTMKAEELLAWQGGPAVVLASGAAAIPVESQPSDQARPVLRLFESQPVVTIYGNEFYLDGEALDGGGLAEIRVNGEPWLKPEHRGAQRRRFAGFLQVEGTNLVTVSVRDLSGNQTEQKVTVISRVPEYLDEHYRLRAAVLPWRAGRPSGGILPEEAAEYLSEIIARPPMRFRLLARGDEWTDVLHELELSASELADPRTAVKIGRLLPADLMMTGSIYEDAGGLTFYVKIVDTTEAVVLYAGDVYAGKEANDWRFQLEGLVSKMEQQFPLLESRIERRQGGMAVIASGRDEGVRVGTKFIVVESDAAVLGGEERFVELCVTKAERDRSQARLASETDAELVKEGVRVFTR